MEPSAINFNVPANSYYFLVEPQQADITKWPHLIIENDGYYTSTYDYVERDTNPQIMIFYDTIIDLSP